MNKVLGLIIALLIVFVILAAVSYAALSKKSKSAEKKVMQNPIDNYFDQYISEDFYDAIRKGDFNRDIYPKFSDRKAWEKVRKSKYADMIIEKAETALGKDIKPLNFSEFRRFVIDGNRTGYQDLYFERRINLSFSVLAMCLTGDKEKYMPTILDNLVAVLEEFTWTIPAHSFWKGKMLLDVANTDLFCAETGAMMAIIYHILGDELDKEIENLSDMIRQVTLQRTVYNIFYTPQVKVQGRHWWFELSGRKNNWTPWCSANCIMTAVLLEQDNEKLAYFIRRFLQANAHFVAQYGDDGFCEEGCNYYYVSGLKLFEIFYLLHKIRPNSMAKVFEVPKHRAMFEFIAHCGIGDKYRINFSDGNAFDSGRIYASQAACGQLLDSKILQDFTCGKEANFGSNGSNLHTCISGLFDMPEKRGERKTSNIPLTYFKDRIAILRSNVFAATLKGGHNAESHNHNDLGHFTVFYQGAPVIIDAGTEHYSQINFSDKRYTLWYTRGSGHNAPVFGDIEQQVGKEYRAGFVSVSENKVVCDLSKAYPAETAVKKFVRTLDFAADKVTVNDEFELGKSADANIKLLTLCDVVKLANGDIKIGDVVMKLDGIEFVKTVKLPKMNGGWNREVIEIYLKSSNNKYKISFVKGEKK